MTARARTLWRAILCALLLAPVALQLWLCPVRRFDPDEFQHLHGAWLIQRGEVPYRDYFEHHPPWFHLALAPLVGALGPSIATLLAVRLLMLPIALAALALAVRLGVLLDRARRGRTSGGLEAGLLGSILLSHTLVYSDKTLEIRPDVPALALALAGFVLLAREGPSRRRRTLLAGLAFGSAFLFTQKVLFTAAGASLAVLLRLRLREGRRVEARAALGFHAGLALPLVITLAGFGGLGALPAFVRDVFLVNARWRFRFDRTWYLRELVRDNPLFAVLAAFAVVLAAWAVARGRPGSRASAPVVLATVFLLAGIGLMPVVHPQYLLPLVALSAVQLGVWLAVVADAGTPGLADLRARLAAPGGRLAGLGLALVGLLGALALRMALDFGRPTIAGSEAGFLALVRVVLLGLPLLWLRRPMARGAALLALGAVAALLPGLRPRAPVVVAVAVVLAILAAVLAPRLRVLALALALLLPPPLERIAGRRAERNDGQIAQVAYVLATTAPDEPVLTSWSGAGVFRPHAYRYFFLHPEARAMFAPGELARDLETVLVEVRPGVVEFDRDLQSVPAPVPDLVRRDYRPTGVGVLWRRRPPAVALP